MTKNKKSEVLRTLELGANGAAVHRSHGIGGRTCYEKRVPVRVEVPLPENAYSRTVRLHELLHAQTSGKRLNRCKKFSEDTRQLCEDMRLHAVVWPREATRGQNRDALATALTDLRRNPEADLSGLYVACRALAIGKQCSYRHPSRKSADGWPLRIGSRISELIQKRFGLTVWRQMDEAIRQLRKNNTSGDRRAHQIIETLLDSQRRLDEMDRSDASDDNQQARDEGPPTAPKVVTTTEVAPGRTFDIVELDRSVPCEVGAPSKRKASVGSRLSVNAYVRSVASGKAGLLYRKRKLSVPQGTVLIDASGSMCPSEEELTKLAALMPAATIATYSGDDSKNHSGELVIVAKRGMRAAKIPRPRYGGNGVDDLVVEWLLTQPAPRRFLCDMCFTCPDPDRWIERTRALAAQRRIELVESGSISSLLALFDETHPQHADAVRERELC